MQSAFFGGHEANNRHAGSNDTSELKTLLAGAAEALQGCIWSRGTIPMLTTNNKIHSRCYLLTGKP
jgi:hypothetical protein